MSTTAAISRRLIRAAGFAAVAVFLALVARFWHPVFRFTSLLQLDASNDDCKIAAFRKIPVFVYRDTGGYDGLYYAQIAYHPALDAAELGPAIDSLTYRARRILVPALAWLLSAGNPKWIVHVYSLLNVAAWLVLAALFWRLLAVNNGRGWIAWAGLLFSAGALSSVRYALTDLTALALVTGAILAAERGRNRWAIGALGAAGLARETSLLALTSLATRPWLSWRNAGRALLVLAPLAGWLGYMRWRIGPLDPGAGNFDWPVVSFVQKWRADLPAAASLEVHWLAWTTLLATLGLTVQAAFFFTRWRPEDRWWRMGMVYSALMFCLGGAVWDGSPGAATRVLLPLNLAFNVLVHRTRAPLLWLLAGNLSVFSGLQVMDPVSNEALSLATQSNGTSYVGRFGDGWFGREHSWRHTWTWSSGRSTVIFEASPKNSRKLWLEFSTRSLVPRTVLIHQDSREICRALVGTERTPQSVPVQLVDGRAILEFSTDIPGVPENSNRGARALAFSVYDPQLIESKP
ncbi:MAG: hypothetical protein EXS39_00220 [Opitutaceae bacterium]|nr:hypothetical protein [Opitutaceae bacterium]